MKKKKGFSQPFPGGNIRNWELVARMITLNPQEKSQLRIALKERMKIRKRREQKRRDQYFK